MAASDYGIIVIKNGVLDRKSSGFAKGFTIGEVEFWKAQPYWYTFDTQKTRCVINENLGKKYASHEEVYRQGWVTTNVEGIEVKAKMILYGRYISKFNYNGDKYVLLHGFDIDLHSFWSKKTKTLVRKFIKKYATGGK